MGPSTVTSSQPNHSGNTPEQAAGTVVYFNGIPAPIFYTWSQQVGVVVPYEVTPGTAQVAVQFGGQVSLQLPVTVAASAPALYTADGSGQGQALAYSAKGLNNTSNPVPHGGVITVYVTGAGQLSPSVPDGAPDPAGSAHPVLPVSANIGGVTTSVAYSGGDTGLPPGTIRIDLNVPSTVTGTVPVILTIGSASSQPGVTIAVN